MDDRVDERFNEAESILLFLRTLKDIAESKENHHRKEMDHLDNIVTSNMIEESIKDPFYKNYVFVFMIVGLITMIPLIIINIAVVMKSRLSKVCRLLLLCICLSLGSCVSALAYTYYILGPIEMTLTKGDQVLIGEPTNGFLMNTHELRSFTCNHLAIQSNRLGIRVWATSIAPHYGPMQNYSLVIRNWSMPTFTHLRLNNGDFIYAHNFSHSAQIIILKGEESLQRWIKTGAYKRGYEKCCSWHILYTDLVQRQQIAIEQNDVYTFIVRATNSPITNSSYPLNDYYQSILDSGYIDLFRTRWAPNPCDPVICDGTTTTLCKITSSPKSYIIDYTVETMTAPNFDYASIRIICYPRHWLLGILFSLPTILILSFLLIISACIKRRKKQFKFSDTSMQHTPFTDLNVKQIKGKYNPTFNGENNNPAFECDLVFTPKPSKILQSFPLCNSNGYFLSDESA
ncbi:hypothetical protein MN116_006383 [Schistosoma mekongi]|uniref:DUF5730 domain-containing protein n=1 Tax=Schistosoma mekongi TaxID=38744 RepID=A0AAE1ZCG8_SCHME|nr:hypothetical protein MN116_006383 [Schistosoma mekongi]